MIHLCSQQVCVFRMLIDTKLQVFVGLQNYDLFGLGQVPALVPWNICSCSTHPWFRSEALLGFSGWFCKVHAFFLRESSTVSQTRRNFTEGRICIKGSSWMDDVPFSTCSDGLERATSLQPTNRDWSSLLLIEGQNSSMQTDLNGSRSFLFPPVLVCCYIAAL